MWSSCCKLLLFSELRRELQRKNQFKKKKPSAIRVKRSCLSCIPCNRSKATITAMSQNVWPLLLLTLFRADLIQSENNWKLSLASDWIMTTQTNVSCHTFGFFVVIDEVNIGLRPLCNVIF